MQRTFVGPVFALALLSTPAAAKSCEPITASTDCAKAALACNPSDGYADTLGQ